MLCRRILHTCSLLVRRTPCLLLLKNNNFIINFQIVFTVLDAKPFIAELFRPFESPPPYNAALSLPSNVNQQQRTGDLNYAQATNAADQAASDSGRTLLLIKKYKLKQRRRKRIKKRLCKSLGRTYPYVNIAYVEVNEYYNCPVGTFLVPAGEQEAISGVGGGGGGLHDEEIIEEYVDPGEPDGGPSNSHGPLGGSVPAGGPSVQYPAGAGGGGGAAGGCRGQLCPSGGPLGFFGEGGLFDFTSGTPNQLVGLNTLQGVNYQDVKPVVEFNVPGSLVDAVSLLLFAEQLKTRLRNHTKT